MINSGDTLDRPAGARRPMPSCAILKPSVGPAPLGPGAGQFQNAVFRLESLLESRQILIEQAASQIALDALREQILSELDRLQVEGILPPDPPSQDSESLELHLQRLRKYLRYRRAEQYRVLAECSIENPNPILRVGLGGSVLDANLAGYAFFDALTAQLDGNSTEWLRRAIGNVLDRRCATLIELQCAGRNFALTLAPVTDAAYVYIYGYDVSSLKEASRIAETLAMHDALTALPNRMYFRLRFDQALEDCQREVTALSVAFVDLDNFKQINDTLGHAAGDRTLKVIANFMREALGQDDMVARWGGDEFVILFPRLKRRDAQIKCEQLVEQVSQRAAKEGGCRVTLSYGIASYPADAKDLEQLLHLADHNLLKAKRERPRSDARQAREKPV